MTRSSNYELYGDISARVMNRAGTLLGLAGGLHSVPTKLLLEVSGTLERFDFLLDQMLISTPHRPRIPLSCSPPASRATTLPDRFRGTVPCESKTSLSPRPALSASISKTR